MYNNRRNKTELENKIYRDIQSEIQKYYDKEVSGQSSSVL